MSDLFDAVWAALPVPALLVDEHDRIMQMNTAGEEFLNATLRQVQGQPVWDRLAIDAPLEVAFERVRVNQSPLVLNDVSVGTGDRPPQVCTVQIAPVHDGRDSVVFLISPRQMAGRIARAHQSETAAKSAIGMAEMLAHEIKNPLAGITGAAQLLSMNLSKEDQELTDLIVAESRRIVKLLKQVEQFGNLRPPLCKPVNIHDLLDRASRSARVGFAAHMTMVEDYDPSLPSTMVDGDQILQVFLNLIKNAAEAAPGGGTIRLHTFYEPSLRVRRKDGTVARVPLQVEIVDDGPGLPDEISDDIFEPFVSGKENGTGLGLALVSKIVADHAGWISVDSAPGRTAFRISLPVAADTSSFDDFEGEP
jgi:two-component system nitrogen regulation sensor histidine kinase GlnL